MKKNVILIACLLLSQLLCAQRQNLDKLPQKERDSLLVEIANEAIDRFSSGYLRPGDKPYIEDIGFKLNEKYRSYYSWPEYIDRYHYAVCYLASEREREAYYNRKYRVKAIILADIGKVTRIEYMDDNGYERYALEKLDPDYPAYIRKFKPAEEVLREREERRIREQKEREEREKRMKLEYEEKYAKKYREFEEMKKRKRDSLRQRYLMKQDSIRREDSIRSIQGTAGMQK